MPRLLRADQDPRRLRWFLGLLLLALVVPSAVLIWQTRQQLRFESLHQYRTLAVEMGQRIAAELARQVAIEEARSDSEYAYLMVAGDPALSNLIQRSPLAEIDRGDRFPGLLGHFQIDPDGRFSTPLLPQGSAQNNPALGLDADQLAQRQRLSQHLQQVLGSNQLLADSTSQSKADELAPAALAKAEEADTGDLAEGESAAVPVGASRGQAAFDQLANQSVAEVGNNLGRVDELRLNRDYADSDSVQQRQLGEQLEQKLLVSAYRGKRKERSALLGDVDELAERQSSAEPLRVQIFDSEVDPLAFALLPSGHGVLYRRVWRDGQRTIQGLVFEQSAFSTALIEQAFVGTALWEMSDLVLAYQDTVLQVIAGQRSRDFYPVSTLSSAAQVRGELLHQTQLAAPLEGMALIWSIRRLPPGPGAQIINMASVVLAAVLLIGFWLLYRAGMRQIRLARQQQDFVSAVSHELKTPLTSIRMYAEMLREGWAGEDKKRGYYDFIHDESERLSRLIANVLQLARLERNALKLDLQTRSADELVDMLRSKLDTQIERAGFSVDYRLDPEAARRRLNVDSDALCQMLINLVDNALKFAHSAPQQELDIAISATPDGVQFSVRDYGPGVAKSQLKKIFELFYRPGDELTREALGTGIGLALVRQLARAMGGEVDAVNRQPGAEFRIRLPALGD